MPTADPIEEYLAGIWTLRSAVAGMTLDQLKSRPIEGKWSTLEVVAHLADFDVVYSDRIKRIIATEKPGPSGRPGPARMPAATGSTATASSPARRAMALLTPEAVPA